MGVITTKTNKPFSPRGNDQSPLAFNRAKLYSGKALDFDGVNDNLTATGSNALSFSQITMSAYFKFDNLGATQVIFAKRKDVAGYWSAAFIMSSSGELDFRTTTGTTEQKVVYSDFVTGEYYHAVGVKDDSNNYLYINGQLVDTTASGAIDNTTTYNFVLGNNGTGQYYYNGQISNAKVFDTALTAAQVADLYNNPEKVVPTGVDNTALKLWLPMMEGAGTTAYDGSGNGNHGTISGATYVNGIGAPVAQSAVMDWNKKENLVILSESIETTTQTPGGWSDGSGDPLESSSEADPTGRNTATLVNIESISAADYAYIYQIPVVSGETYTLSIWTKLGTASNAAFVLNDTSNWDTIVGGNYVATAANGYDEWKQVSITFTATATNKVNAHIGYHQETGVTQQDLGTFYIWGAALHKGSTPVLVPTFGTAQSSEVLLPQGLTTGRDITGVNLFENVRKQGALNLDGNSWAEVHDNASLDVTTAITLEAWVYWDGTSGKGIFGRWDNVSNKRSYLLYIGTPARFNFFVSSNGLLNTNQQNNTDISTGWNHIIGVYDGTNIITYLNGSADGSKAYSSDIYASDVDIEIGRYDLNSSFAYPNDIAQPRIYNRALTAEEVQRSYDSGKNIYTNS